MSERDALERIADLDSNHQVGFMAAIQSTYCWWCMCSLWARSTSGNCWMRTLISDRWNTGGCPEHWDKCLRCCAPTVVWWGCQSPGFWPGTSEHSAPGPRSPSLHSNRSALRWCSLAALSLQTDIRHNPTSQKHTCRTGAIQCDDEVQWNALLWFKTFANFMNKYWTIKILNILNP